MKTNLTGAELLAVELWAILSLLLDKGIITDAEFAAKYEESKVMHEEQKAQMQATKWGRKQR